MLRVVQVFSQRPQTYHLFLFADVALDLTLIMCLIIMCFFDIL